MSNPIRPKDIVDPLIWQQLQKRGTWLDSHQEVRRLWGLRRLVKPLPLLGRLAEPKASLTSIRHIKQQLRNRNISETDIKLLLKIAKIIKLGCSGGILTEKAYKAINKETLGNLITATNKSRGELLELAASESRGSLSRFIEKERQKTGTIGYTLPVAPVRQPVAPYLPTAGTRTKPRRTPITRLATTIAERGAAPEPTVRQLDQATTPATADELPQNPQPKEIEFKHLFTQLQLKDARLKAEHFQPLVDGGILRADNLYRNNDKAIERLTQQACEHLRLTNH
ncbi:DUF4258 domain-containing protein [Endozoicomonas euniceicola]|uniref:DUF4258 domain-containing protein n=1 Tax=Endozoicomonas euniceicola TaxID=1234143 RepID=A0ABY6GUT1_9GAMM|nr:DUF4258 domain-containing protein [Endozoicomonas euniceicola]UYM16514.1 DUF4258 domain-containing protein [Endozoicomonas euniceicola]